MSIIFILKAASSTFGFALLSSSAQLSAYSTCSPFLYPSLNCQCNNNIYQLYRTGTYKHTYLVRSIQANNIKIALPPWKRNSRSDKRFVACFLLLLLLLHIPVSLSWSLVIMYAQSYYGCCNVSSVITHQLFRFHFHERCCDLRMHTKIAEGGEGEGAALPPFSPGA